MAAKSPNAPSRPIFAVSIAEPFSSTVSSERTAPSREIGMLEQPARFAHDRAEFERDRLKMQRDSFAARRRQGAEQPIACVRRSLALLPSQNRLTVGRLVGCVGRQSAQSNSVPIARVSGAGQVILKQLPESLGPG
jgi:hypothetical protein